MRRYETIFIVPADLADDEFNGLVERYEAIIANLKGTLIKRENWGKRKLAYEIRKQTKGFYVLLDFAAKSEVVDELERNLRLDDKVLKYMTVKREDSVSLQEIEKEIALAKPEKKEERAPEVRIVATSGEAPQRAASLEAAVHEAEAPAPPAESAPESQGEERGGEE